MWGLNLKQMRTYREARVHAGYRVLLRLCKEKGAHNCFVWTSNVDGAHAMRTCPDERCAHAQPSLFFSFRFVSWRRVSLEVLRA